MKQESAKKNKKVFLWIAIAVVALAAIGVALAFLLPGTQGNEGAATNASSKVYWNADRLEHVDPDTGLSARTPGEDGLYHILFAVDGEQVELTCADKKLVNKLDLNQLMGLVFDGEGRIIDLIKIEDLVGKVIKNVFVQKVTANGFTTNSSVALNGMEVKYKYTDTSKVYDVSGRTEKIGAEGEMAVMDKVTVLQDAEGNVTHVFIVEAAWESDIYWRVSPRLWNSTAKKSARIPDADGYCSFEFFVNGEYVTLRSNKQDCIDAIDSYGNTVAGMGLIFDENGNIIDVFNIARAAKGMTVSNNYTVMSVDGDSFSVEALTGSDQGKTYDGYVTGDTKIYDMSNTSVKIGAETDIRVGDNLLAIANPDGDLMYVFVTKRIVDAPVYVVMNRSWSNSAGMTQKPDEEGWYVIDVVAGTKRMKVRTKDAGLASQMHEPIGRLVGLRLEGDEVVAVYDAGNVTGGKTFGLWEYVTAYNAPIITSQLGSGSSSSTGVVSENCKVYYIGFDGVISGKENTLKETKLMEGDRILAMTDEKGEVCLIYVFERKLDLPVYWVTDGRKWDSAKQETKRVPDEEGYYTYTVTTDGKRPFQVKTKDKKIANYMDSKALTCYTLKVDKNGIVTEAYTGYAGVGGASVASYYVVTSINGNRVEAVYPSTGATTSFNLLSDYKCYNVSSGLGVWEYMGEKDTIRVGDKIQGISWRSSCEVAHVFIVNRPENDDFVVGWKTERKYNTTKGETTREPDADGYYVYQMAVKGEIKTFKTKDKAVANALDKEITALAMNVKNGIVYRAVTLGTTKVYGSAGKASYYTIMKIDGNKVYTQNTAGKTAEIELASKYECYDVSAHAEKFGAKTTIKVGDKIHAYYDDAETGAILVYVVNAYNRKTEMSKPCPHCGEVVLWTSYTGVGSGHYYLSADRTAGQISIGADADGNPYDFVLDMNGYDWDCPGKAILVWKNAKAYIFDSTGYDYTIKAVGPKDSYHSGVIQMVEGELTLVGGNYVFDDSNGTIVQGGVLTTWSAKSVINATGVDFVGGTLVEHEPEEGASKKANMGGTMAFQGGTANFNDCTFTGGVNPTGNGGNLYIGSGTTVNFNGCTITGGTALRGGAVAILNGSTGNVTMTDTVVTGGKASSGGGVFMYNGTATLGAGTKIQGNTLKDGTTVENFWVSGANSVVTMNGVKIPGGAQYAAGELTITGNTVIEKAGDAVYGLTITNGCKMILKDLGANAKIGVTASGTFTEAGDAATLKGYVDSGKVYSDDATTISVKDSALTMGIFRCINGHTEHGEDSDCAEPIVSWKLWNDATAAAYGYAAGEYKTKMTGAGNFILIDDLNLADMRTTGNGTLRIDLNGHNITRNVDATTASSRTRVFYTWDPNTGDSIIPELHLTDLSTEGEAGKVMLTYSEGVTTAPSAGAIIYGGGSSNGGNIVIAGRVVLDTTNLEGSVSAVYTGRNFIMYNGTIKSGATALNINDAIANVVILGESQLEGSVMLNNYDYACIVGNAKLDDLRIAEGKVVDILLDEDAKIFVDALGTFTVEGDAETLQGYLDNEQIVATDSEKILSVKDNALHMEAPVIRYCLMGHTEHTGEHADCELEILEWQKWKSGTSLPTSGNYILTSDVTVNSVTEVSGTLAINLNGFDITKNVTASNAAARTFTCYGNLSITDTSTEGEAGTIKTAIADGVTATYSYGGVAYVGKGVFTLAGRAVLDASNQSTTTGTGGATIQLNNATATFNMYGGTVKGLASTGTSSSALHGWSGAKYNIYGGTITSGTTGEVAVYNNGTLVMTGGKIEGGLKIGVDSSSTAVVTVGGDAQVEGTLNIVGCTSFTVSGTPTIEELKIATTEVVDFTGITGGEVTVTASGVFTTDFADADAANAALEFVKAAEGKEIVASGNALSMQTWIDPNTIMHCINGHTDHTGVTCGEPIVEWKYWNDENGFEVMTAANGYSTPYAAGDYKTRLPGNGNWILIDDLDLAAVRATGNAALRIDLAGHNITRNVTADGAARAFTVANTNGMLAITDLSTVGEAGVVKSVIAEGVAATYSYGAVVYVSDGSFRLAGRAIIDGSNQSTSAGTGGVTVQLNSYKSMIMYGGVIKSVAATSTSSAAINGWGGSSVTIHGGEILCVETEQAVYAGGNFTMDGGKIQGGLQLGTGTSATGVIAIGGTAEITGTVKLMGCTSATISGTPIVENINNTSGKVLNMSDVTGGNIGVQIADGVFTTNFASNAAAEAATKYIGTTVEGKSVVQSGKTLKAVAADRLIQCIKGHTNHAGVECDQPILIWKYWNNENAKASYQSWGGTYNDGDYKKKMDGTGNWILIDDINATARRTTGNGHLRIDLNGHNYTRTITSADTENKAETFYVTDPTPTDSVIPTLTITDNSTEGEAGVVSVVQEAGVTTVSKLGAVVYVGAGNFYLAGRAVLDGSNISTTNTSGTVTVQVNNDGESFVMYSGTVKGLASTGASSSAVNSWTGGTIDIRGGQVIGTDANKPAIYTRSPISFNGTVTGGVQIGTDTTSTGTVVIGSAAVIDVLDLKGFGSITIDPAAQITTVNNTSGKEVA